MHSTLFDFTAAAYAPQSEASGQLQRSLLKALPDVILLYSPDGRYVDYYTNTPSKLYLSPEEFLGRSVHDILPPAMAHKTMLVLKQALEEGSAKLEYRLFAGGQERSFEARMQRTEDGHVLSLVRDISCLKSAEARLKLQNRYLSAVQDASLELMNRLELDEFLDTLLKRAAELAGVADGVVYILDDALRLEPAAWLGSFEALIGAGVGETLELAGSVWEHAEARVLDAETLASEAVNLPGLASVAPERLAVVPLLSKGCVSGLVCLAERDSRGALTDTTLQLLKTFAQLASVALDNAQLFDEAQRELHMRVHHEEVLRESEARYRELYDENARLHEQTLADLRRTEALHAVSQAITGSSNLDELLSVIVASALKAVSAYWSTLYVLNEQGGITGYASTARTGEAPPPMQKHDFDASLSGWSVRERSTAFSPNGARDEREALAVQDGRVKWELGSVLCIPLVYKHSVLGTLAVVQHQDDPDFSVRDRELLEGVASQVALALKQRQLLEQVRHDAYHDILTSLPNRLLFEDRLEHSIARAKRNRAPFALLFVDLDGFKTVNDTLGHAAGDKLLVQVAERLGARMRASDTLARMGGDEFALILNDLSDVGDASGAAESYLEQFKTPFVLDGIETQISASIGVAVYPDDGKTAEDLLRRSDSAMYRVKRFGKNGVQRFSKRAGLSEGEELMLERDLSQAVSRNELEIHYQPQIHLARLEPVGAEALLRWRHPERGLVAPNVFIPLAEKSGLIGEIGEWVLREACRQNAAWQREGHLPLQVAVNVSVLQFMRPDFISVVASALKDSRLEPVWLELELTESIVMQDTSVVAARLEALREMGVRVAIDDFGTGYSSLQYLQQLEFDSIKIDRSFIWALEEDSQKPDASKRSKNSGVLVKTMIAMAQGLGLSVVAEGIETAAQLSFLQAIDCTEAQGYFFAKPMPAAEMWKRIAELDEAKAGACPT